MGNEYGGKPINAQGADAETIKKVGIKVQLTRKRNEVKKSYSRECPRFPQTFNNLGRLDRQLWYTMPKMRYACP